MDEYLELLQTLSALISGLSRLTELVLRILGMRRKKR